MSTLQNALTLSPSQPATCPRVASSTAPHHVLELYSRHAESARAAAFRLLYDHHEAEDVVHDVFLSLWLKPDCFDPERGTDRAWLLTVVRHRSMDHLRRRSPHKSQDVTDLADRLPDPEIVEHAAELDSTTRGDLLWSLVDALPSTQADLIRRAYVSGHTHQRIARDTGLPLGTVKSRIRLGLDKLRCVLRQGAPLSQEHRAWPPEVDSGSVVAAERRRPGHVLTRPQQPAPATIENQIFERPLVEQQSMLPAHQRTAVSATPAGAVLSQNA